MQRRRPTRIGAAATVLPAWWALRRAVDGGGSAGGANGGGGGGRHTGHAALERVFPALGPLTDARWTSSRDHDDRGLPSPDLVIVGLARLAPAGSVN
ncbi:hypothetical protein [Kitasatospora fiedleri]|uniref:hypothetical protein n=1 Tax=Kitasatospora fiedleri TaxID=2991545 RepID=UPI00249B8F30|nr:hypothetical protein [Kitasatospora fiedleri]